MLGDRFHSTNDPCKSELCKYHNLDLCLQATTIMSSTVESQSNRKNQRKLRSSTVQNSETHLTFNNLMDFYQNEQVVEKQLKVLKGYLSEAQHVLRDEN